MAFRRQRLEAERTGVAHTAEGPLTEALGAALPFEPTRAQRRAMDQIGTKMNAPQPMNVLLQGDVGSGKTLVALHACLVAIQSGHQAAIMAPTEVLAGQHARSVADLLRPMGGVAERVTPSRGSPDQQRSLFEGTTPASAEPEGWCTDQGSQEFATHGSVAWATRRQLRYGDSPPPVRGGTMALTARNVHPEPRASGRRRPGAAQLFYFVNSLGSWRPLPRPRCSASTSVAPPRGGPQGPRMFRVGSFRGLLVDHARTEGALVNS